MTNIPDHINFIAGNINEIQFSDIFIPEEIQNLQDLFAEVHGVASIITTTEGKPLTKPSNFCRLCNNIIRNTEKGLANCYQSDAVIGSHNISGPVVRQCLSGGLWDAGASITVGGKHIANWLIGQVRNQEIDEQRMNRYADEICANRDDFMKAFKEVPVMSVGQFKKVSKMLFAFANELSEKAYNNYLLKKQIAEREKVSEALRISEERYRSILSASPDTITITDLDCRMQMVSTVGLKMFGYKEQGELIGHLITDFILQEDRERASSNVALMFQGTMSGPGEYRGMRGDGSIFDIEANAEFIFDDSGQPIQLVFIVRDITERKKAETDLKHSEEEYRLIAENASDVIRTMDLQGNCLYISPSVFNMTGYTVRENMMQTFEKTLAPESAIIAYRSLKAASARILSGEIPGQMTLMLEHKCKNGSTLWTEIIIDAVYDDFKKFKYYIGVSRDISKRKRTEDALIDSKNQKAAILRAIPDLLLFLSQNGDCLEVYAGDDTHYAATRDAFIGKNIREFFPSYIKKKAIEAVRRAHQNKEVEQLSYSIDVNGKTEFYEARIVSASDGKVLVIIRDNTERNLSKETIALQNNALSKLNQFSIELSTLSSEENLDALIARNIKEFTSASAVIFSEFRTLSRTLTPKHVEMDPGLLQKALSLIGNKIEKLESVISEDVYEMMTRNVIKIYNDLNASTFGTISKPVGALLKSLLKADRFIGLTYLIEGEVYGTTLLALGKHQPDPPMEMLTNFIFLAAVSLRRRRAEELLLLSEQTYRGILDSITEAVYIEDMNGEFLDVNLAAEKMYGYSKEEFIGQKPEFLSAPGKNNLPQIGTYLEKSFNGKPQSFEFWGKRKDGTVFPKDVSTSAGTYFGRKVCVTVARDITHRKQSEEELHESERFLKETQLIASLGTYTFEVATGKWVSSELLDNIFGIDAEFDRSIEGWVSIIHPKWQSIMDDYFAQEVIGDRTTFDKEYEIIRPCDQVVRWVHGIGDLKYDGNNNVIKMIGTIQDITKSKMAEFELVKAKDHAEESDRLKSAFLANMSHEIRTPMNGILGFAGLLKEPDLTSEEQEEYIQIIEKSGTRMLNIINDIMSISKVESGQMEISISKTNINSQIKYLYTFFKPEVEGKGMQLTFISSLTETEAVIKTDKEKVYAILTNLIKNAIKFTNTGSIEFGYRLNPGEANNVSVPPELEFFVRDTGIGISEAQKVFIFDRFRQGSESLSRNYEGAGLGLAISKAYAEMLGGKIWVKSEVGKGSVFYFTIPYKGEQEKQNFNKKIVSVDRTNQIRNLKVLIAEDDDASAMLVAMTISDFSKEIIKARTGIEAIEACQNNPDIDLVLMDIKMPVMDGYNATMRIRQFNQNVVIIAQTAYALTGDREKAIAAGCNDYIAKPIIKDQLLVLMHKYFGT